MLSRTKVPLRTTHPSHIRRLTSELNSPMPVIDIAHQHMLTARAGHISKVQQGTSKFEVLDWGALISGVRVSAGLSATGSGSVRHKPPSLHERPPDRYYSTRESFSTTIRPGRVEWSQKQLPIFALRVNV